MLGKMMFQKSDVISSWSSTFGFAVLLTFAFQNVFCNGEPTITFTSTSGDHTIEFQQSSEGTFDVHISEPPNETFYVQFSIDGTDFIYLSPQNLTFNEGQIDNYTVTVTGRHAGQLTVYIAGNNGSDSYYNYYNIEEAYMNVKVKEHAYLDVLSDVIGWIYFVAWIVSFYPQIWINFRRKSVIGLNLDFVTLNVVGFTCYSLYNCGLYFIPAIKDLYFDEHPYGVMPIQVQDIAFALLALFSSILTALQALFYERGGQKVSKVCLCILCAAFLFLFISLILSCTDVITWLDYLYYFSYVKLAITIIKYCPQAYFNFRRKSTKGWSIGNILLDFTGGSFSMLQMFIIAYNYDDWSSLFGDPTKFGLGLFSILFDVLFMVQHYILYRNKSSILQKSDEGLNNEGYTSMD